MPLISQAEAMHILAPHSAALFQIAASAWDEYHSRVPQDLLVAFCRRTRASAIHNLMVRDATRHAAVTDGVRMFERKLMRGLVIGEKIAIRLKKLGDDNLSKGHYTNQVEEFRSQQMLDGIDAPHHLELGYVLNADETEVSEVRLVCPSGRGYAWASELKDSGIQPVVFGLLPTGPAPSDGGAVIKPKSTGVVIPIRRTTDED